MVVVVVMVVVVMIMYDDHDDDAYDSDSNDVYYGAGCAGEMACACVTRSRRT